MNFLVKCRNYEPDMRAAISDTNDASITAPSKFKHTMSQYKVQTNLSGSIHKLFKSTIPVRRATLLMKAASAWAFSLGIPGRNCDEHNGGNSTFMIRYPFSGSSTRGGPNSYKNSNPLESFPAGKTENGNSLYRFDATHATRITDTNDCRTIGCVDRVYVSGYIAKFINLSAIGTNVVRLKMAITNTPVRRKYSIVRRTLHYIFTFLTR